MGFFEAIVDTFTGRRTKWSKTERFRNDNSEAPQHIKDLRRTNGMSNSRRPRIFSGISDSKADSETDAISDPDRNGDKSPPA